MDVNWLEETPTVTADEIRRKLQRRAAAEKTIFNLAPKPLNVDDWKFAKVFVYELWTLTESRKKEWVTFPIQGVSPYGSKIDEDLDIWSFDFEIPVKNKETFTKHFQVPGTDYVTACEDCNAGSVTCHVCNGKRSFLCEACDGRGSLEFGGRFSRKQGFEASRMSTCHHRTKSNMSAFQINRFCYTCKGLGRFNCIECGGTQVTFCRKCRGKGNFKNFIKIRINWTVHKSSWCRPTPELGIESDVVVAAAGEHIWEQTGEKVVPISFSMEDGVTEASQRLVERHSTALEADPGWRRVRMQRQSLRLVPVTRVDLRSPDFKSPAFVVGVEDEVVLERNKRHRVGCFSFL